MGVTRILKAFALVTTILLIGVASAACSGNSGGGSDNLVPQRANIVGNIDFDQFLDEIDLDLEQILQSLPSDSLDGTDGIDELFNFDPTNPDGLFGDVSRIAIFADADAAGEADYFGLVLYGNFDETALISELESISGTDLVQETYKESNVYSPADETEEFMLSVLDSKTFAVGTGGALNDIIDLWLGDADPAAGALIDALDDLGDGIFGFAASVPEDALNQEDLGSFPGLGDLPISLDFISALKFVGLGGDVNGDSLDFTVNMEFANQESAESLEGFISGIVSLAAGFAPDPRTSELLAGLEVDQDGSRLTIIFGIPKLELTDIFGDLTTITNTTTSTSGGLPPGTPEIILLNSAIGEEVAIMPSADHVPGGTLDYSTTPPTSGRHWPEWADCGWYPGGLRDEQITHNLEHGNIVVSYNFTNPAQVTELRQILRTVPEFEDWGVARFYDKIPEGQVAVSAWGRLGTYQGVAVGEIQLFFEAYAGQLGPERITC
jgi:hypothetical protein